MLGCKNGRNGLAGFLSCRFWMLQALEWQVLLKTVGIQMRNKYLKRWIMLSLRYYVIFGPFHFFVTLFYRQVLHLHFFLLSLRSLIHSHTNPPVSSLKSLFFLHSFFKPCISHLSTSSSHTILFS